MENEFIVYQVAVIKRMEDSLFMHDFLFSDIATAQRYAKEYEEQTKYKSDMKITITPKKVYCH